MVSGQKFIMTGMPVCVGAAIWTCLIWYLSVRWTGVSYIMGTTHPYKFLATVMIIFSETIITIMGALNITFLLTGTVLCADKNKNVACWEGWRNVVMPCDYPSVAILIPTYKEDESILRRTLDAVRRIDYPAGLVTVIVGDDGKRESIAKLMTRDYPEMYYHVRQHVQGHAKAGNINDILMYHTPSQHTDFVLILDCDMAPQPTILQTMVPLFYDKAHTAHTDAEYVLNPGVAFVQSPQSFINIKEPDFLGQAYNFFYHVVLPSYSGFASGVPCCGTNVVFQRRILQSVGGFQYGSITEDFLTSLHLHSLGYISRYTERETAKGFAPDTLVAFYDQRQRWCIGGLQILCSETMRRDFYKLRLSHKWIYAFSSSAPYLNCLFILLLVGPALDMLYPSIFLGSLRTAVYVRHFVPYTALYSAVVIWLHRRLPLDVLLLSLQETMFLVPMMLQFVLAYLQKTCFRHSISFKPTPKKLAAVTATGDNGECPRTMAILLPYLSFYAFHVVAMRYGRQQHGHLPPVDIAWSIVLMIQMMNPVCFFLQTLFC